MKNSGCNTVSTRARLQEALELRNKKPCELSKTTGISLSSIVGFLSGQNSLNSTDLFRISLALDVNDMWLSGHDAPMELTQEQKENRILAEFFVRMIDHNKYRGLMLKMGILDNDKLDIIHSMVDSWESPFTKECFMMEAR